jgi:murein DD-endopeptidase MepM/ murein hydrolase activator NlpD
MVALFRTWKEGMGRAKWLRGACALGLAAGALAACATLEERTAQSIEYIAASSQAGPDDAVEFSVRLPPQVRTGRVTFLQRTYPLYARPDLDGPVYTTFLPVPFGTPPGEYPLRCVFDLKRVGSLVQEALPFQVIPDLKALPEERLAAKGFTASGYIRDLKRVADRLAHPQYLADRVPAFILPQGGTLRTGYGTERVYNGRDRVRIEGIEIEALSTRTDDVLAAADGQVLLAERLPMLGNIVLLDHGYAIATLYAHLRTLEVTPGQTLERGRRLGRIGRTGAAAAGVRLRYSLYVAGVAVDVQKFTAVHVFR